MTMWKQSMAGVLVLAGVGTALWTPSAQSQQPVPGPPATVPGPPHIDVFTAPQRATVYAVQPGQPPQWHNVLVGRGADEKSQRLGELVREYKSQDENADEAAKAATKEELTTLLREQFDARQAQRQQELADLEARVQKLRELLNRRQEARDEIVNSRLTELLRSADGLGWDEAGDVELRFTTSFDGLAPVAPMPAQPPRPGR
ncbi:MAG: hypothetical protein KF774_07240 [Planctomyces sp.]|nr:hypothetical protein [Planctomyces sp.]